MNDVLDLHQAQYSSYNGYFIGFFFSIFLVIMQNNKSMLEKYLSMKQKYLELKTKQAGKSVDQFTFKNIDFSKYLPYLFMMFDGLLYERYGSHLSINNDYLKAFTRKIKNSLLSKILKAFQTNLKLTTSLNFAKKNFFCDWSDKKKLR